MIGRKQADLKRDALGSHVIVEETSRPSTIEDNDEDEIWKNCTSSVGSDFVPSIFVRRTRDSDAHDHAPMARKRETIDGRLGDRSPRASRRSVTQRPSRRRSRINSVLGGGIFINEASSTRGSVMELPFSRADTGRTSMFSRGELTNIRTPRRGSTLHLDDATLKMAHLLHQRSFNLDDERIFGGDMTVVESTDATPRALMSRKFVEEVAEWTNDVWWNLNELIVQKFGNVEKAFEHMATGQGHSCNLDEFLVFYLGLYENTPEGDEYEPGDLERMGEDMFDMLTSIEGDDYIDDGNEESAGFERRVEFRQLAMRLAGVGEKLIRQMRSAIVLDYGSLELALAAAFKDKNDLKALDQNAFTAWFTKVMRSDSGAANQAKRAFMAFDVDNSGTISVTELQRGLAAAAPMATFSQFKRRILLIHGGFDKFEQHEKARWPQWSEPLSSEIVESISFHYDVNPRQTQDFLKRVGVISDPGYALVPELEQYIDKFGPEEFGVLLFLHKDDHEMPDKIIGDLLGASFDGEKVLPLSDFAWRFFGVDIDGEGCNFEGIPTVEEESIPKERDRLASPSPAPSFRAGVRATVAVKRFSAFNKLAEKATRSTVPVGRTLQTTEVQELYDSINEQMGRVTPTSIIRSIPHVSDVLCCDRRMYHPGQRVLVRYRLGSGRQHDAAYRPFVAIVSRQLTYIYAGAGGWYLGNKAIGEFGSEAQCTELGGKKEGTLTFTTPFPSSPQDIFEFRVFASTSGKLPGRQIGGSASFDITCPGVERPDIDRMCLDQMNETTAVVVTWNSPEFEMYQGVRVHEYVIKAIPKLHDLDHTLKTEDLTELTMWSPQRKGVEQKLSYEFKGLSRGVNYEFAIQPIYKRVCKGKVVTFPGTSSPNSWVVESPYCEPSGAPGKVHIVRHTEDELELCWAPPEEKGLAEIYDYEVQSCPLRGKDDVVDASEDNELWDEMVDRKVRMRPQYSEEHQFWVVKCQLTQLPRDGTYRVFRVIAANEAGRSAPSAVSEPVFFFDKKEVPVAPTKLRVECTMMATMGGKRRCQRAHVRAFWIAPPTDNVCIPPILGYELVVSPADSALRNEGWQAVKLYLSGDGPDQVAYVELPLPVDDSVACVFKLRAWNSIGKSPYSENSGALPAVSSFAPPPIFVKPSAIAVDPEMAELSLCLQNTEDVVTGIKVSYSTALSCMPSSWDPWRDVDAQDVWFREGVQGKSTVRVQKLQLVERNYLFRVLAKSREGEYGAFSEESNLVGLNPATLVPTVSNLVVRLVPVGQFGVPAVVSFDAGINAVRQCDVEAKNKGAWEKVHSFVFGSSDDAGKVLVGLVDLVKPQSGIIVCRVNASNVYGSSGWVESDPLTADSQESMGDLPQPAGVACRHASVRKEIYRLVDGSGEKAFHFDLNWDRVSLADGYEVQLQRGLASSAWQPMNVFIQAQEDSIHCRAEINDGTMDTMVRFRVRATRCGLMGPWSPASESLNFETKTPPKPSIAHVHHTNCVALQLAKVTTAIIGYRIERQEHSNTGWRDWPFLQCSDPESGCVFILCPLVLPTEDYNTQSSYSFRVAYQMEPGWTKTSAATIRITPAGGITHTIEDLTVLHATPIGAVFSYNRVAARTSVQIPHFPPWWHCLKEPEVDVTAVLGEAGVTIPVYSCNTSDARSICFLQHEWSIDEMAQGEVAVQVTVRGANKDTVLPIPMSFCTQSVAPNEDIHIYYAFDGSSYVTVSEEFEVEVTIVTVNEFGENVDVSVEEFENAGHPVTFTVTPELPCGLTLDDVAGSITGSPLNPEEATTYVIKMHVPSMNAHFSTTLHFGIVPEMVGEVYHAVQDVSPAVAGSVLFMLGCDAILHLVTTLQQNAQPMLASITFNRVLANEKLFTLISETPDDELLRPRAIPRVTRVAPTAMRRGSVAERRKSVAPMDFGNGMPISEMSNDKESGVVSARKESSVSELPKFWATPKRRYTRSRSFADIFGGNILPDVQEDKEVHPRNSVPSDVSSSSSSSEHDFENAPCRKDRTSRMRVREPSLLQPQPFGRSFARKRSTSLSGMDLFSQWGKPRKTDSRMSKISVDSGAKGEDPAPAPAIIAATTVAEGRETSGDAQRAADCHLAPADAETPATAKRCSGGGTHVPRRGSIGRRASNFVSLDVTQCKRPSFLLAEEEPRVNDGSGIRRRSRAQLGDARRTIDQETLDKRLNILKSIQRIEFSYNTFVPHFFIVNHPLDELVPTTAVFDFENKQYNLEGEQQAIPYSLQFTVSPPFISDITIDAKTGIISGTPRMIFNSASYTVTCRATQSDSETITQTAMILTFSIVSPMTGLLWTNPHRFMCGGWGKRRNVRKRRYAVPQEDSVNRVRTISPRPSPEKNATENGIPFQVNSMFQPLAPSAKNSLLLGFKFA